MNITFGKLNIRRNILRYLALFSGLFVIANGIVLTIGADLGVNPWDVLHIGIADQVGITIGRVIQVVGLMVIIVSFLLKVRPYIGTILNMIFLGLFVDLVIGWGYVPHPDLLWYRILIYFAGVVLFGFGVAFYISANLGAGPRDSLMLALTRISRFRVGTIRTFMEITAAIIGFMLGGPLGVGTVMFALSIGLFMEMGFSIISWIKKTVLYKRVWFGQ